jgi:AsmA protein
MKRRYLFLATLLAIALLIAAMVPWQISTSVVTREASSRVKALTGLALKVDGPTTIALLPVPRVKMDDVVFTTLDGDVALRARQMRGELRWLPLIAGRIELSDATLLEPSILTVDARGASVWRVAADRLAQQIDVGRSGGIRHHVGRVMIVAGKVEDVGSDGNSNHLLTNINAVMSWPLPTRNMDVAGNFVWRDTPVTFRATGINPVKLFKGEAAAITADLAFAGAALAVKGELLTARGARDPQIRGDLTFSASALSKTLRTLGEKTDIGELGALSLFGSFQAAWRMLSMPTATLVLDGDRFEGALASRLIDGRPLVSGTLAAETLSLDRFLGRLYPARGDDGKWSSAIFDTTALANVDIDLRLSASSASIGRVKLNTLGGGVILKDGRLEVALSSAAAYKGALKGRFSLAPAAAGIDAKLQGSFERIDVAPALADAMGWRRISGTGHGQFVLEATGGSFAELARGLSGRGSILVKQGDVTGLNVGEAVRRAEQRPLPAAAEWLSGRTTFEQLTGTFAVASGAANTDVLLTAPTLKANLVGNIRVAGRLLELRGAAKSAAAAAEDVGLPFAIVGPWDEPSIGIDMEALIQRSGNAGPLDDPTGAIKSLKPPEKK